MELVEDGLSPRSISFRVQSRSCSSAELAAVLEEAWRKLLVGHELWHDSVTLANGTFPDPDDEALAKTEGEWLADVRNLLRRAGRDL